jgi:hypothetical protein
MKFFLCFFFISIIIDSSLSSRTKSKIGGKNKLKHKNKGKNKQLPTGEIGKRLQSLLSSNPMMAAPVSA